MDAAGVGPSHLVLDLGSGEGTLLLEAARRGAQAIGVELDGALNAKARSAAEAEGLAHLVELQQRDLMDVDPVAEAAVHVSIARTSTLSSCHDEVLDSPRRRVLVVMYLLPECLDKLRPAIIRWLEQGASPTCVITHL